MYWIIRILFGGLLVYLVFEFIRTYILRPRRFNQLVKNADGKVMVITQFPHGLKTGEKVFMKQDDPPPFGTSCRTRILVPGVDGFQKVISIPNPSSFIIDVSWQVPCVDGYNAIWSGWYNRTK